ncbi:MAG: hypothetical protein CL678_12355 [Bdellovibrionaceae bacterium]|nr:hypothetical protein [Pseudobdellovibrionaceae bacterium]|tara:strand:+ start:772 stop:1245 length:474 start_codon:yes stop_codon:yes gene_type:complete
MRKLIYVLVFVLTSGCEVDPSFDSSNADSPESNEESTYFPTDGLPTSKFRCCPKFTEEQLAQQAEDGENYACNWKGCRTSSATQKNEMGQVIAISCIDSEENDYVLTRCDNCICNDGSTIIGQWKDGIPTFHCSGDAFSVESGGSCGNPNCEALCGD